MTDSAPPSSSSPTDLQKQERPSPLLDASDANSFFSDLVGEAITEQGVAASESAELYLVSILAENAQKPNTLQKVEQPLALRLAKAMSADGGERFNRLRRLGDDVLFLSGFFAEHLSVRGLGEKYVNSVGQVAYSGAASTLRSFAQGPAVYEELSDGFGTFVCLLQHIADSLFADAHKNHAGVLELYERWHRTRSEVLGQALLDLGVLPTAGAGGTH